ncbi:MAG: helix-turn-helix domain containing protein [Firmicutes bacterium]|nr:helix-turn-helix domain containing protein [Bacillota bacterium]
MVKFTTEDIQKIKEAFFERLEEFIGDKSLIQWSKEIGIPSTTVTNWKLKRSLPKIEYCIVMSKKLGVTIDYLFGLEN